MFVFLFFIFEFVRKHKNTEHTNLTKMFHTRTKDNEIMVGANLTNEIAHDLIKKIKKNPDVYTHLWFSITYAPTFVNYVSGKFIMHYA